MTSRSEPREEIITIRQPVGTDAARTEEALRVARRFATERMDAPHSRLHVYGSGERQYAARWTKARAIVVEVL